jgi:hypothetical protein
VAKKENGGRLPDKFQHTLGLTHPAYTLMGIAYEDVRNRTRALERDQKKEEARARNTTAAVSPEQPALDTHESGSNDTSDREIGQGNSNNSEDNRNEDGNSNNNNNSSTNSTALSSSSSSSPSATLEVGQKAPQTKQSPKLKPTSKRPRQWQRSPAPQPRRSKKQFMDDLKNDESEEEEEDDDDEEEVDPSSPPKKRKCRGRR